MQIEPPALGYPAIGRSGTPPIQAIKPASPESPNGGLEESRHRRLKEKPSRTYLNKIPAHTDKGEIGLG